MTLWWLSFCDPERPKGEQFLGVAIVEATDIVSAAQVAYALGCNPGGEIRGFPISEKHWAATGPEWRGRLLTKEEVQGPPFNGRQVTPETDGGVN